MYTDVYNEVFDFFFLSFYGCSHVIGSLHWDFCHVIPVCAR